MTRIVFDSDNLSREVIKNINNSVSNMRKISKIVNSLDVPSLNSGSYIKEIPSYIEDIISDCNNTITNLQDSTKRFNDLVDNSCSDISKSEVSSITIKDFYVNNL